MTRIAIVSQWKPPQDGTSRMHSDTVETRRSKDKSSSCHKLVLFIILILVMATSIGAIITFVQIIRDCGVTVESSQSSSTVIPEATREAQKPFYIPTDDKPRFSFDDMYNSDLVPHSPQGQFAGEDAVTYLNNKRELVLHNITSDVKQIIMTNETFITYNPDYYTLSPDKKYVLITYDLITELQDTSTFAKQKVYNRETGALLGFPADDGMRDRIVMYTSWTPIGSGLTFVFDDDMYYQSDPLSGPERLTTSGGTHKIRNGLSFWNYRGVLQANAAIWWSPDMSLLAYGEFDSTEIPLSEQPIYNQQVYPSIFRQVYLQAGDAARFSNSMLHVIDMNDPDRGRKMLSPPSEFENKDCYFYKALWNGNNEVAIGWTDRVQTRSIVEFCNPTTLVCRRNHDMTVDNGWFTGPHLLQFIHGGDDYLAVLPQDVPNNGRYRHVAMVSSQSGEVTFLTEGTKEVYWVDAYDSIRHLIYYTGTNGFQLERHVFSVGTSEANEADRAVRCITCEETCQYASATFNPSTNNYLLSCAGPGVPYYHFRWTYDTDKSITLEDNAAVKAELATRQMPTIEYHKVNIGDGYDAWGEFIMPPGMVKDGSVKYPVMFYPYAGPHGTTQGDYGYKGYSAAGGLWDYHLASSHNVIVVRLNGRGTGGRGDEYLFQMYRRLGTIEITDQIDGAKSMMELFPYVDGTRMAIWGWSYGGYTASHVLGEDSDVFKCGIAVAPVTNFRHYYAGYTERYMGLDTAEDNAEGYDRTNVIRKVHNFHGKRFLLAHGSLDDNVHFQNAMELMNALSREQVLFRTHVYVDQNHSIRNRQLNRHLFLSMTDFYSRECLGHTA